MKEFTFINQDELIEGVIYVAYRKKVNEIILPNGRKIFIDDVMGATVISEHEINFSIEDGIDENAVLLFSNTSHNQARERVRRLLDRIDANHRNDQLAKAGAN